MSFFTKEFPYEAREGQYILYLVQDLSLYDLVTLASLVWRVWGGLAEVPLFYIIPLFL